MKSRVRLVACAQSNAAESIARNIDVTGLDWTASRKCSPLRPLATATQIRNRGDDGALSLSLWEVAAYLSDRPLSLRNRVSPNDSFEFAAKHTLPSSIAVLN